jgi:hypothetical protein
VLSTNFSVRLVGVTSALISHQEINLLAGADRVSSLTKAYRFSEAVKVMHIYCNFSARNNILLGCLWEGSGHP